MEYRDEGVGSDVADRDVAHQFPLRLDKTAEPIISDFVVVFNTKAKYVC